MRWRAQTNGWHRSREFCNSGYNPPMFGEVAVRQTDVYVLLTLVAQFHRL